MEKSETVSSKTKIDASMLKKLIKRTFRIELISLNSLLSTSIVTCLQVYLLINRFRVIRSLQQASDIRQQLQLNATVVINIFLLTFSFLFTLIYFLINALKLGIYMHDNVKLGAHLLQPRKPLPSFITDDSSYASSNSPTSYSTKSISTISKQKLTSSSADPPKRQYKCSIRFKLPFSWAELPPLGACSHLISALCLLMADLQLNSRRIQLSEKPIGDIFTTRLDFIFGPAVNRLKLLSELNSLDDFSIFKLSSNYSFALHTISLDYLNFLLALLVLVFKTTQIFWQTSRLYATMMFGVSVVIAIQMSVSYCAYELLYKVNSLRKISRNFLFQIGGSVSYLMDHDLIVSILFVVSSILLYANVYLLVKFGYAKYSQCRVRFEEAMNGHLARYKLMLTHEQLMLDCQDCPNEVASSSSSIAGSSRTTSSSSSSSSSTTSQAKKNERRFNLNLISLVLMFVYVSVRFTVVYDLFVVFNNTRDLFLVVYFFVDLLSLLMWIFVLVLLTLQVNWSFGLNNDYKIVYWNWLFTLNGLNNRKTTPFLHLNRVNLTATTTTTTTATGASSSVSSQQPARVVNETNRDVETNSDMPSGLLVRDDSVLSKSCNLSSSSITEVSSLMPSTITQLPLSKNHSQNVQLNVANLAGTTTIAKLAKLQPNSQCYNKQQYVQFQNFNNTSSSSSNSNQTDNENTISWVRNKSNDVRHSIFSTTSLKTNATYSDSTIGEIMEKNSNKYQEAELILKRVKN